MKKWLTKISKYLLLILFLSYYASITFFSHPHTIDGVSFVHSHPFSPGDSKNPVNHQHTTNGLIIIQLLSNFASSCQFVLFSLVTYFSILKVIELEKQKGQLQTCAVLGNGLRAPPVL